MNEDPSSEDFSAPGNGEPPPDRWRRLERITTARNVDDAADELDGFLKPLGIDGFGFGLIWRDGDAVSGALNCARGRMTPLVTAYLENGMANGDPVLRAMLRGERTALWSHYFFNLSRPVESWDRRAEIAALMKALGVEAGATINLNDFGGAYRAVISFTSHPQNGDAGFEAIFNRHGWAVRTASLAFCDLALREGLPSARSFGPTLSNSERLVLEGLVRGQRARDIALSLGKSEHTVRNQIAAAQARLGARTKEQAVAIALRRGLIKL
jgi:DNA-binding CsgD family transcriptional regulator